MNKVLRYSATEYDIDFNREEGRYLSLKNMPRVTNGFKKCWKITDLLRNNLALFFTRSGNICIVWTSMVM